jgi:hypothetical protein
MTDISQKQGGWTPGPWKAHLNFRGENGSPDVWQIDDEHDAVCTTQFCYAQNTEANARLIAAAPDLYEALREAKRALWIGARDQWNLSDFKNWAVVQQIDGALDKARANPSTDQGEG